MGRPIRWKYQKIAMLSRQRKRFEERPKYSDPLEITTENGLALETEASSGALREYIRTE